jgi:hypothetical protein
MGEVITTVLGDIFDLYDVDIRPDDFQCILQENGFVIVPIEDPTNLFGIMEDSL